jgi:hypothetical protein
MIEEETNLKVLFFAMSVRKQQSRFEWQKRGLFNLELLNSWLLKFKIAIFRRNI